MSRPSKHRKDQEGAALLLALVFILFISLIMIAIVTLSGTDILNTSNLQNERNLEYSAEGAVQAAIQGVRYLTPDSTLAYCASSPAYGAPLVNDVAIDVYCQASVPAYQRSVTFEACSAGVAAGHCVNDVGNADVINASVLISDVSSGCFNGVGKGCDYNDVGPVSGSTSGFSVTIDSWIVDRANG